MATAIRSNTASAVSMDGKQKIYGVKKIGSESNANALGVSSAQAVDATGQSVDSPSTVSINAGPAYEVEISDEGKKLTDNKEEAQKLYENLETRLEASRMELKQKQHQEWRIQRDVARFRQTEENIRTHEAAHMSAGGAFAGGVSYVYAKAPDGKMYVSGGEVPIQAPEGKTPEETARNMEIVRRAALAPADPSGQDVAVAAMAMQIENRARAAIRQGQFLKQSDMDGEESSGLTRPPVWPTSMAGLIATLMPQQGMMSASRQA
jgi:hypothetical protein